MTTAKELALAHWEGYVQPTIEVHMPQPSDPAMLNVYSREDVVAMCRHHYISAWVHGAKHQEEAQKEAARGAFANGAVHGAAENSAGAERYALGMKCKPKVAAQPADLAPIFALIAKEHSRSLKEHQPWEDAAHAPDTMINVIKAELAEVDLALSMRDHAGTVEELVHVANVAVKAIAELTRRGHL